MFFIQLMDDIEVVTLEGWLLHSVREIAEYSAWALFGIKKDDMGENLKSLIGDKTYTGNKSIFCMFCGKTFEHDGDEKAIICPYCGKEVDEII